MFHVEDIVSNREQKALSNLKLIKQLSILSNTCRMLFQRLLVTRPLLSLHNTHIVRNRKMS